MATSATDEAIYATNNGTTDMENTAIELAGTLALCSTLLLYLSELPLLKTLTVQRCCEGVQYSAILINLINNIFGFAYGVLSSTEVMQITNGVGTILHIIMCLAFIGAAHNKSGAISSTVAAAAFVGGSKLYLDNIHSDVDRLDALGLLSTVVCFFAFTVPGIAVLSAWQTKNPCLVCKPITWGSLICSVCWGVYGFLLRNPYIIAPNVPGICISLGGLLVCNLLEHGHGKKEV